MQVATYTFPTLTVNCVGTNVAIQDLDNYFRLHHAMGIPIHIFTDRIISNHVYCYMEGNKLESKLDARQMNRKLKQNGLLIGEDDFWEAMFVAKPDEMAVLLGISDDMKKTMLQQSQWTEDRFS